MPKSSTRYLLREALQATSSTPRRNSSSSSMSKSSTRGALRVITRKLPAASLGKLYESHQASSNNLLREALR
eukprot:2449512-Pyramimonas_sp.AAC.1